MPCSTAYGLPICKIPPRSGSDVQNNFPALLVILAIALLLSNVRTRNGMCSEKMR